MSVIKIKKNLTINYEESIKNIGFLINYNNADPYPHCVIEDFLPEDLMNKLKDNFAGEDVISTEFNNGYQGKFKRQINPEDCNGEIVNIFRFFNSAGFISILSEITGIEKLMPDPFFVGGGFHETKTGGRLGVHSDFRINKEIGMERRINLIIYLNEEWEQSWGGELELWSKDMKKLVKKITPVFNRAVIFNTDDTSFHGHPEPLKCPSSKSRRSIALYYYTSGEEVYNRVRDYNTNYKATNSSSFSDWIITLKINLINLYGDIMPPILKRLLYNIKIKYKNKKNVRKIN